MAAGIPTVGILSGQEAAVLLEAGASALVHDFHALVAVAHRDCLGAGGQQQEGQQQRGQG